MTKFDFNVPIKYVPIKLSNKDKEIVKAELEKSRKAYKKNKYYTRKKVKSFQSKKASILLMQKKCMI